MLKKKIEKIKWDFNDLLNKNLFEWNILTKYLKILNEIAHKNGNKYVTGHTIEYLNFINMFHTY